ncbi:MAG: GNAT family N-acetyltransferase [Ilumatobacteraceae bacterium]
MEPFLITDRLLLRRFTLDDAEDLLGLDSDPAVRRFVEDGEPATLEAAVETIEYWLAHYEPNDVYGFWAAIERETGSFLGWFHFRPRENGPSDEPELGYRLVAASWGKGYATEGSRSLINMGFRSGRVQRVVAETMTVNGASRRVMEKAGMRLERTFHAEWPVRIPGDEEGDVEYALTRAEWRASADQPRTRHSAAAVAMLFFVNGATFSNWLPRIPEIRDNLGLDNAGLGATLLGGGLGGIIGALVVGKLMDRLGSRRVLSLVATALSIGMPLIAFAPSAVTLLVLLTTLGVLDVCNDVAMNAQGVIVQQRLGRSIMNRLHAMWSLGFTGGALVGSAASAAGASVRAQLLVVGILLFATVSVVRRWLIPVDPPPNAAVTANDGSTAPTKRFSAVTILMGLAALGAVALEVMPNDWAAVLMRDVFDFGRASGFGTVACAGAMLVGRLGGDHVLDRIGERRLFTWAVSLVGLGAFVTVLAPAGGVALAGLVVWGLGLSVVFPQLYATAARLPGVSAGTGLGSMLLGQRLGAMLTAVSVGGLAQWKDLRVAFAVVAVLAFVTLLITSRRMMAASA